MSEYIKTLPKPIAVVGMGKSGNAARRLLWAAGILPSDIVTFDGKQAEAQYQNSTELMNVVRPRTLVVSPGVPLSSPWILEARQNGVHITSEINLACSVLDGENIIGVTGSVGKSTTVSILGAGLTSFSKKAFVGGNLGLPFADYAADVLEKIRLRADWVILELSSYQLENSEKLQLELAAITYFTANHLERYSDLNEYYDTKWKIAVLTRNQIVLNRHGGDLRDFFQGKDSSRILWADRDSEDFKKFHLKNSRLIGEHNQDNLAVACLLALKAGWPESSIEAMKNFTGLSHRLENLGEHKGIRFINDSKATAMDSVLIAVQAASQSRNPGGKLFTLLGGRDKNLPWQELQNLKFTPNADFIFFGECREIAQSQSHLPGLSFKTLGEALDFCFQHARANDVILLSPGGTSLDEFKNFEERGNFFRQRVQSFMKT